MVGNDWVLLHDGKRINAPLEKHTDYLLVAPSDLRALLGWQVKDNTLCRDDRCLPLSFHPQLMRNEKVDLFALASLQQMPLAMDEEHRVLSIGESVEEQGDLLSTVAPDFELPDAAGKLHRLSDYRGKKILLVTWASWCGCRDDLPVWQELYVAHKDQNFIVLTIAQDSRNSDALPFIEAAKPLHPALIDNDHLVSRRYGFINVPTVIWIDEEGRIVRPPRVEHGSNKYAFVHKLDCEPHLNALKKWIATGETDFSPEQTSQQIVPPTFDEQLARAEHALAWYLYQHHQPDAAKMHWDKAIALSPNDWTIRRGSMRLRGEDPFGNDFFQVWDEWEKSGKPDYISLAAQRNTKERKKS
jgi:peroxiredoxin